MPSGFAEARLFLVHSTVRIAKPKAGLLRAARPRRNHPHQQPPEYATQRMPPTNALVGPTSRKARLRARRAQPGIIGKKPGFAEARLFLVHSTVRIAKPKAGLLRAARPRRNHPHQQPPEYATQRMPPTNALVGPTSRKARLRARRAQPGIIGKKPGFAEARLFLVHSTVRIAKPKAGLLRAARPRRNHPHQQPPEYRRSACRQRTPWSDPLQEKPGFAHDARSRASSGRSRALPKPGFF